MNTNIRCIARGASIALLACLVCQGALARGKNDPVPDGWVVIRSGQANKDSNYANETRIGDRYFNISALCAPRNTNPDALASTDTTRDWSGSELWQTSSSTIIANKKQSGKIVKDEQAGNPNHCLINDVDVTAIKGVWHKVR
ncbi:hypothetical protein KR767_00355 [Luteibacter anthropi]|uniref:hypothetical protein n=1 Tax=Luteibacter anthropi TaxID=564369 RepID=UPI002032F541|nr:hypothetical protein [Luteibacter anthropi]URX62580.1 hypothetical protein KR767_00355 [Luteibacter anthropi]